MIAWFASNIGNILVSALLLAIVSGIVIKMRKDKQRGKSACGGNCAHCAMGCSCHAK